MSDLCLLSSHGQTAFFRDGSQVGELQKAWFAMYLEFLEGRGVDPLKVTFEASGTRLRPFKTEDGEWNW